MKRQMKKRIVPIITAAIISVFPASVYAGDGNFRVNSYKNGSLNRLNCNSIIKSDGSLYGRWSFTAPYYTDNCDNSENLLCPMPENCFCFCDAETVYDPCAPTEPDFPVFLENPGTSDGDTSGGGQISDETGYTAEVVRLVNAEREKYGLSELESDSFVQSAAQVRAKESEISFSHTRPDGRSCFTALSEAGVTYSGAGENIAYGQKTPAEVVKAWMDSPGHRANILNKNFTRIGVGYYKSGNTIYWSQFFVY